MAHTHEVESWEPWSFTEVPDCPQTQTNNIIRVQKRSPKQNAAIAYVNYFLARGFTCRAFTYAMEEKRCYLSGDDSVSLSNAPLVIKRDAVYAEKQCSLSKCKI